LDREKLLPVDEVVRITRTVASSLQTAHDAGAPVAHASVVSRVA
jgi:hypothetical protein